MAILRSRPVAAVAGAVSWTALEYGLHRATMHQMRGRGLASVEHLQHHADITYFSPTSTKVASACATTTVVYPLVARAAGRRWSAWFTAGLIAMYGCYEVAHRRTHTHPPRNRYERWARRNHLHHHFHAPMRNFGVTTLVWDRVFGTDQEMGTVAGPDREPAGRTRSQTFDRRIDPQQSLDFVSMSAHRREFSDPVLRRSRAAQFATSLRLVFGSREHVRATHSSSRPTRSSSSRRRLPCPTDSWCVSPRMASRRVQAPRSHSGRGFGPLKILHATFVA